MLIASMICILIACVGLAVGVCFVRQNKFLYHLLFTLALICLVCLGVICSAYKNDFSGYSIVLIVSVLPIFLTAFCSHEKRANVEKLSNEKEIVSGKENFAQGQTFAKNEENLAKNDQKIEKNTNFFEKYGNFVCAMAYFLSAIALAFCGLYLGKESFWCFPLGLAIGLALTFLSLIINKSNNGKMLTFFERFFQFSAVGLLVGGILLALLYSFSITNILFAIGALVYCAHIFVMNKNFAHLAYFLAMLLLFATIIF